MLLVRFWIVVEIVIEYLVYIIIGILKILYRWLIYIIINCKLKRRCRGISIGNILIGVFVVVLVRVDDIVFIRSRNVTITVAEYTECNIIIGKDMCNLCWNWHSLQ